MSQMQDQVWKSEAFTQALDVLADEVDLDLRKLASLPDRIMELSYDFCVHEAPVPQQWFEILDRPFFDCAITIVN